MPKFARFIERVKKHAALGVLFALVVLLPFFGESVPKANVYVESSSRIDTVENTVLSDGQTTPQSLHVPKLNLTVDFGKTLGLKGNREVEVPSDFDKVGWYKHSPVPGDLGPSVVLGHVDSREGPAVFYSIGQLRIGDEIFIERSDGRQVIFEVTGSERYEQTTFPTDLVYGDLDHAGLRLVTCSGWYDKETDRYSHNRVIFAKVKTG